MAMKLLFKEQCWAFSVAEISKLCTMQSNDKVEYALTYSELQPISLIHTVDLRCRCKTNEAYLSLPAFRSYIAGEGVLVFVVGADMVPTLIGNRSVYETNADELLMGFVGMLCNETTSFYVTSK